MNAARLLPLLSELEHRELVLSEAAVRHGTQELCVHLELRTGGAKRTEATSEWTVKPIMTISAQ